MTKTISIRIIEGLRKYYGKVEKALSYSNIYELTIAVVLSAQTTDKQVNRVTPGLFSAFPGFGALSQAPAGEVERLIKSVGLYKTKARNIVNLSKDVVAKYNNIVPDNIEGLMSLPGVGRKSANVILSMGYNIPAFPVDTHILRIANRMGYVGSSNPHAVEKALTDFIPEEDWIEAHLLFINHGRKTCHARKPLCRECPVSELCDYANRGINKEQ